MHGVVDRLLGALGWLGVLTMCALLIGRPQETADVRADPILRKTPAATLVRDHRGHALPRAPYQRIVSTSCLADSVLLELVGSHRMVGVTRWFVENNPGGSRLAHLPRLDGPADFETIVGLRPDLVVISQLEGDENSLVRLRKHGLRVFELGPMRGRSSLTSALRTLGSLVGEETRGSTLAARFERRLDHVAESTTQPASKRALYLSVYDTQLHGGTVGSSYHDILVAAGLRDAAAEPPGQQTTGFSAWPQFQTEDVLAMDPDVIVTARGKARLLCNLNAMDHLRACRTPGSVVELDEQLLNDPGFGMLDAAEAISDAVFDASLPTKHPARLGALP